MLQYLKKKIKNVARLIKCVIRVGRGSKRIKRIEFTRRITLKIINKRIKIT